MHGHGCQGLRCRLYLGGTRKLLTALEWGDGTEGLEDEYGLRAGIWREPDACFFKSNWLWFFSSKYRKRGTYCQFPTRDMVYLWCFFLKKKKNRKTPYYITPYTQHIYIETPKGLLHRHTPTSTDIFSHTHTHCLIIFLGSLFCFSVAPFIFFCPGTPGWWHASSPPVTQA